MNNLPKIKLDLSSTAYFFGKWIPFAIAIGIVTGSIASLMDFLIVGINNILKIRVWFLFLYPLVVSIIIGIAIHLDRDIAGPGIGYAISHIKSEHLMKLKTMVLKLLTSVLTLSGGFIAGREGPSFFVGAALGEHLGKIYGISRRFKSDLGLIGGGAFTGALLKAPLGSSVFAMELENMYNFNYKPFAPMIVASIVSYLTFSYFRGEQPFIELSAKPYWELNSVPYIIVMGLTISAITYVYAFTFHFSKRVSMLISDYRRPVLGTVLSIPLLIGLYLITNDPSILSAPVHMTIISKLAQHSIPVYVDASIVLLTILITSLTLGFGIPGGLVLPNLLIGAAVGNMFGHIFPHQIVMFTLAGMGAALAAGAKTPLAAIVMITEMSRADVVIPMTAAVITSYTTSFGFSLYIGQEKGIRQIMGKEKRVAKR